MLMTTMGLETTWDANGIRRIGCGENRSEAVMKKGGEDIVISTQSASGGTALDQVEVILDRILELVDAAGGTRRTVLTIDVTMQHGHHNDRVLAAIGRRFAKKHKPAVRHQVGEVLGTTGQKVEISATATMDEIRGRLADVELTAERIEELPFSKEDQQLLRRVAAMYNSAIPDAVTPTLRLFSIHVAGKKNDAFGGAERSALDALARPSGLMMYN